jgi:hypothetical protein
MKLEVPVDAVDARWLLYCLMLAGLGLFFQHCMEPGMIFRRYYLWLIFHWIRNRKREVRWKRWPLKPLGLCVYCNTAWLGVAFYMLFLGLNLWIFLFLGLLYATLKWLIRVTSHTC